MTLIKKDVRIPFFIQLSKDSGVVISQSIEGKAYLPLLNLVPK